MALSWHKEYQVMGTNYRRDLIPKRFELIRGEGTVDRATVFSLRCFSRFRPFIGGSFCTIAMRRSIPLLRRGNRANRAITAARSSNGLPQTLSPSETQFKNCQNFAEFKGSANRTENFV
jgi:hypothetical protein